MFVFVGLKVHFQTSPFNLEHMCVCVKKQHKLIKECTNMECMQHNNNQIKWCNRNIHTCFSNVKYSNMYISFVFINSKCFVVVVVVVV